MNYKSELINAYKTRIDNDIDKDIYLKALGLIDNCSDLLLWALTHRDKESFNREFTDLSFCY